MSEEASSLRDKGNYEEAISRYKEIIELESTSGDSTNNMVYVAYLGIGNSYIKLKNWGEAKKYYQKTLDEFIDIMEPDFIYDLHIKIGELSRLSKNYYLSAVYYNKALHYSSNLDDSSEVFLKIDNVREKLFKINIDSLNTAAEELLSIEQFERAGDIYYFAYNISSQQHLFRGGTVKDLQDSINYTQMATSVNGLSNYSEAVGRIEEAITWDKKSIEFLSVGAQKYIPAIHIKIADKYGKLGDHINAVEYYHNALASLEEYESNIPSDLISRYRFTIVTGLHLDYINIGDWESSLALHLDQLKYVESFPETKRKAVFYWTISGIYDQLANYYSSLEYADLAIDKFRVLDNPEILADHLTFYTLRFSLPLSKEKSLLNEALKIYFDYENDIGIAECKMYLGGNSWELGKYDEGRDQYFSALKIYKSLNAIPQVIDCLASIATNFMITGERNLADQYIGEMKEIINSYENPNLNDLTTPYKRLADFHETSGEYDEALIYHNKRIEIHEKYKIDQPALARQIDETIGLARNDISRLYAKWGDYEKSLQLSQENLDFFTINGDSGGVAGTLSLMFGMYMALGDNESSLRVLRREQEIHNASGSKSNQLSLLISFGMYYASIDSFSQAIVFLEESLNKSEKMGVFPAKVTSLFLLGQAHAEQKEDSLSHIYFQRTVDLSKDFGLVEMLARSHTHLGRYYQNQGNYEKAINNFLTAIDVYEKIRLTASGKLKREYFAQVIGTYTAIASCYISIGENENALNIIELSKARYFSEQLQTFVYDEPDLNLNSISNSLSDEEVIIVYSYSEIIKKTIMIAVTVDTINIVEMEDSIILSELYPDNEDATLKLAIKSYRNTLKIDFSIGNSDLFGAKLYNHLLKPLKETIGQKSKWLIMPDGILGYLPFETLIDENGSYMLGKHEIKYIQSLSVWNFIKNRTHAKQTRTLLAIGGATYRPQSYEVDMIKNDRMLAYLNTTVYDSILTRGSMSKSYAALGYSDWSNLPWSLHEVENISQVMNSTDLITSEFVSEEKIKVMSQTGQLADYRIIHFATHGIVVPDLPELSAVVLSQFNSELSKEDGYLRISEVSELNIKADLVTLSACETGLGKIYPGEGVVGLTQAFMLAGANAVSVSLWPVADEATSKFMISMYEKIANGSTYSSALNNTKLEFISGKFGDEYRKPYYWAPFVYYGN